MVTKEGKRYEEICKEYKKSDIKSDLTQQWIEKINRLRALCPYRKSSYLVSILACYLVARSSGVEHDEAERINLPEGVGRGFHLRGIANDVASVSVANGIDVGSRSPDMLNGSPGKSGNIRKISDITVGTNKKGIFLLHELVKELGNMSQHESREALLALIETGVTPIQERPLKLSGTLAEFMESIIEDLNKGSDYGNTLVSIVAGCVRCTLNEGEEMHVGKTNDPDRKYPCDITVYKKTGKQLVRSYEVKDKKASAAEVRLSLQKMKRETCLPPEIVFCLCKGIAGNETVETIRAIHIEGAIPRIFIDVIGLISHLYKLSGMTEKEFCLFACEEMRRVRTSL